MQYFQEISGAKKILEMLQEDGHVKVSDLGRIFKVSEVTIRQDLERLDKDGFMSASTEGLILNLFRHRSGRLRFSTGKTWSRKS